jgi:hypothetical protein
MITFTPNHGPLREQNNMHWPGGSSKGGQFAPKTGGGPQGSVKLPAYLKNDVRAALNAGIHTFHNQQPEPVKDLSGKIHDPLAMSHADSNTRTWRDDKGFTHTSQGGKIYIVTRGGEYQPERNVWQDKHGWTTRKEKKELSPADLKHPASVNDIVSTFRHEMGHLLKDTFKGTKKTPRELASEISAWQYAIEITPSHRVSNRMMATGLISHAYSVFRAEALRKGDLKRVASYDFDEVANRTIQSESQRGFMDPLAMQHARAFTTKALSALHAYGRVLTAKGLTRIPTRKERQSKYTFARKVTPSGDYQPPTIGGPRGTGM